MQFQAAPITTDLVLLGGGHSHLFVLRHLAMNPLPGLRITLITRDIHTPYSGMLPGFIAGHYEFDETHIDLRPLAQFANANLIHAEIENLDADNNRIDFIDRPPISYDLLSINIGSRPSQPDYVDTAGWQVGVKPIDRFLIEWQKAEERLRTSAEDLRVVVVGGGAGGVELALSLQHRVEKLAERKGRLALSLVTNANVLLPSHNTRVRNIFEALFVERGIPVIHNQRVTGFDGKQLATESGAHIDADLVVWVTQAGAASWLSKTGLDLDDAGFIRVSSALQSVSHGNVFAAGDIASVESYQRPKSGVFAVRQGLPLAKNLLRYVKGLSPRAFRPQRNFLSLISTGDKNAVASRGSLALQGSWCWTWKDNIDRKFMDRFQQIPEMSEPATREVDIDPMRCAGCGSKLGSNILEQVLVALDETYDAAAQVEDAAVIDVPPHHRLVQSVDYFRSFIDDLYLFGRITALHALGDLFAMGVKADSAQVMAAVAYASEDKQREDLLQLMSGVKRTLDEHQVKLLGGHSSEAEQSACGLSVNGFVGEDEIVLSKSGMQEGDQLILLKPLGSGVLFAADMRARARGQWIDHALHTMLQSSWPAVEVLRQHNATACTDVTGFGLIGHLFEMLRASGRSAEITVDSVAVLNGVLELIEQGIESSLAPQNRTLVAVIDCAEAILQSARYAIMFDPQTAGGLLASVPASDSASCLQSLHEAGFQQASIIGKVITPDKSGSRIRLI